jgi:hypothetical protein
MDECNEWIYASNIDKENYYAFNANFEFNKNPLILILYPRRFINRNEKSRTSFLFGNVALFNADRKKERYLEKVADSKRFFFYKDNFIISTVL